MISRKAKATLEQAQHALGYNLLQILFLYYWERQRQRSCFLQADFQELDPEFIDPQQAGCWGGKAMFVVALRYVLSLNICAHHPADVADASDIQKFKVRIASQQLHFSRETAVAVRENTAEVKKMTKALVHNLRT